MRNRPRAPRLKSSTVAFDVWQRELGHLSATSFTHRLLASQDLVVRLNVCRKLEKHRGCVNTVSFNAVGEILVSGSDDREVIFWDWESGRVKLSFNSGHSNNIFQAKIIPYTHDKDIVTCAADGQIRHAQILDGGQVETKLLGKHRGRAHKLAIEPENPRIFYSCGEDGLVQRFDLRSVAPTKLFYCEAIHKGRNVPVAYLNTIAVDPWNPCSLAVAGSDEYARLYDIRKYCKQGLSTDNYGQPMDYFCPTHLIGDEQVVISSLTFSNQRELLVSYSVEHIYLFTRDMGLGADLASPSLVTILGSQVNKNMEGLTGPQIYVGHKNIDTVKGVNFFGPKCDYVVSGSDCGRIFIWKKKGGELIQVMNGDKHVVNCIEAHPYATVLASSGIENDVKIWTP